MKSIFTGPAFADKSEGVGWGGAAWWGENDVGGGRAENFFEVSQAKPSQRPTHA